MKYGYCVACRGPCQRPEWITYAGGQNYANNDFRQQMAIAAWHQPVTTERERAAAKAFVNGPTFPCAGCGKHAFPAPDTLCYWCRPKGAAVSAPLVETSARANASLIPPARKRTKQPVTDGPTLGL